MKRKSVLAGILICASLLAGACVATSDTANAEVNHTYYSTTVPNPEENDYWFRDVGDGTDTLAFLDGKWELMATSSARRAAARQKYIEEVYDPSVVAYKTAEAKREEYLAKAEKDPHTYDSLPDTETMLDRVVGIIDGQYINGYYRIPKVEVPMEADYPNVTWVTSDLPVMLPIIGSATDATPATDANSTSETTITPADTPSADNSSAATDTQTDTGSTSTTDPTDIGDIHIDQIPDDLGMGNLDGSKDSSNTDDKDTDASTPDVISGTGDSQTVNTEKNAEGTQAVKADESKASSTQTAATSSSASSEKTAPVSSKTSSTPTKTSNSATDSNTTSSYSALTNTHSAAKTESNSSNKTAKTTAEPQSTDNTLPNAGEQRNSLALIGLTAVAFVTAVSGALNLKRL